MRKIITEQRTFGSIAVEDIEIDPRSRDDMAAVLLGLQAVYCDAATRRKLFALLKRHFQPGTRKDRGRPGMDLWRIIVLAVVKQSLNLDYDRLEWTANHDCVLRQMLGHGDGGFDMALYKRQTLKDNVQLITPVLLAEVIALVASLGHKVLGKKPGDRLRGRCDSKVVKTHIHYPTDVNLLWDSMRCLIRVSARAATAYGLPQWRQHHYRLRRVRRAFMAVRTAARYRRNHKGVKRYLRLCRQYAVDSRTLLAALEGHADAAVWREQLSLYLHDVKRQVDQIRRRILEGETIPHPEKVFSIFKRHSRWISKGKAGVQVEFGIPIAVIEDHYQFILNYTLMWTGVDVDVAVPLVKATLARFPDLEGCSFDRGFHSASNREALDTLLKVNALPKKGKLSKADRARQSAPAFKAARAHHPAVESCLANLNQRGGDVVREKSPEHFAVMVGLSVLAVNVHRLGCIIRKRERARLRRRRAA